MIRYIEKGTGLHEAIAAAGHSLSQVDGVWIASDPEAVQRIIDEYVEVAPVPEVSRRDQLLAAGFTEAQADAILALG
jgi:hypothetical protein